MLLRTVVDHTLLEIWHNFKLFKTIFSLPVEKEERIKILVCALCVAQRILQQIDLCISSLSIWDLKFPLLTIPLQIQKSKTTKLPKNKTKQNPTKTLTKTNQPKNPTSKKKSKIKKIPASKGSFDYLVHIMKTI